MFNFSYINQVFLFWKNNWNSLIFWYFRKCSVFKYLMWTNQTWWVNIFVFFQHKDVIFLFVFLVMDFWQCKRKTQKFGYHSPREYHRPSSQWLCTDIVYLIYLLQQSSLFSITYNIYVTSYTCYIIYNGTEKTYIYNNKDKIDINIYTVYTTETWV